MVAVISVDAYPFLTFSDLTCHLEDTGIGGLVPLCCLIVRRLNLEISTKRFPMVWIFLRSMGVICYER